MNRLILGALLTLALLGVGLFWLQGRAQTEEGAPPPIPVEEAEPVEESLPTAEDTNAVGPAPPEATELTREQRRFYRYDRNRDQTITRNEMLSTRSKAFRKLDVDGNNLLSFEEWAVATAKKFDGADRNGNAELTPAEFATTRPKPAKKKPACRC
ncbi:EF-hand domain-containing protein [Altererythrobacter sp. ZODW24]|uniref:EF-hand domain-containing protein n=1 Tax=Altererythrobacter sp. ZODW24 TaxID=2185142 RepID=UPI000DF7B0F4|nr:EF-hand domain-containing protein [Altererythrobacter sp. ZODW24]